MHFPGDETGLQWEDYLFELQNAVEWRMAMSRGQDERSEMHAMSVLLNTCSGMTNRVLIAMEQDGYCKETSKNARTEQLVSKLSTTCCYNMLAATTSGSAKGARETRAQ